MKRIFIYDVAAENGGAATVLKHYYELAKKQINTKTVIAVSKIELDKTDNIEIIRLPWSKRSKIHRIFCDKIYIPVYIRMHNFDEVISLQNIAISSCNVFQTVYLHNAIPFSDIRFKFKDERALWFFQKIVAPIIRHSLNRADKIIVQAEWMKKVVSDRCKIEHSKIVVERMEVDLISNFDRIKPSKITFFYPATPASYKNHRCIVEACKLLKLKGITDYIVQWTTDQFFIDCLTGKEELPIQDLGMLSTSEMVMKYRSSILIFPSYLETVGLPLLEAQKFNAHIIAANCEYARETVGKYKNVSWFEYNKPEELAMIMQSMIKDFYKR